MTMEPTDTQTTETQLEFTAVSEACPPGSNPAPAKPQKKSAGKLYYVAEAAVCKVDDTATEDGGPLYDWPLIQGSQDGFRTKEEAAKFLKTLNVGEYTLLTASTKKITVSNVRHVKGV